HAPERRAPAAAGERPVPSAGAPSSELILVPTPAEPPAAAPLSLVGTESDGPVGADASGHLVLGPGVLRFFAYYLTGEGEESDASLRARILREARRRLPAPAVLELESLLEHYLRYRGAGRSLSDLGGDPERVHQRLRELRREHLGERAAAALYAEDDAL